MKLLDQFIAQTGRQPANWTSQDIRKYLHYVEKHLAEAGALKRYDLKKEKQTMKMYRSLFAVLAMSLLLAGVSGCEQGPAERAGKKIDETVEKGEKQIEKAGKKIREGTENN